MGCDILINYDGIVIMKSNACNTIRTADKQAKIVVALKKFHSVVGKKARENERRAAKSLEYARITIAK